MANAFPWPLQYRYSTRRKTLAIEVREGRVLVRAPQGYPRVLLDRAISARVDWITSKVQAQSARIATRPRYRYTCGEVLPYLGGKLTLKVVAGVKLGACREGAALHITTSARSRKPVEIQVYEQVTGWYREQAQTLLSQKTQQLSAKLGKNCRSVKVRATRSKWGHCTRTGDIQYNWQILLAPESVVDYLVAHEVSHLRHQHHGAAFWRQVASLYPGYDVHQRWLREHGHTLSLPQPES
ncbi:M48 family metallopeptidase [Gilvimarinus agarilyticus]|uniref:M48 family metallopeptidase n=1 Tax=unclassified Gilvimarinus TaxID=2642066 RepID=UPI001C081A36|nr:MULTISPECIES: SprT family zinc-dependent metalloprotease [unclassified Gilvimarinus]MBU2886633.1 M48 family metallopeptidase [Gilvimarinus agarilyticus]MDO6571301.1 SprT family zinc-dependent metalloprotease [Gilvimarinus sp. 2_MG-2023]MDO6746324.1 SprT family zinc-dependent metalloprotease [Gilvimarinus sp. 1_MG-2023]